jgi:hypothetical protein
MQRYRSAITGRWVTASFAKSHPRTTVAENPSIVAALKARLTALLTRNREKV